MEDSESSSTEDTLETLAAKLVLAKNKQLRKDLKNDKKKQEHLDKIKKIESNESQIQDEANQMKLDEEAAVKAELERQQQETRLNE